MDAVVMLSMRKLVC